MATLEDYAMLSAAAYNAQRDDVNKISLAPTDWSQISTSTNPVNGFGAQAYSNGTEVVMQLKGSTIEFAYDIRQMKA